MGRNKLCTSCGACAYITGSDMIRTHRCYLPPKTSDKHQKDKIDKVCPAKGYSIVAEGASLFPDTEYDYRIGHYRSFKALKSLKRETLLNASSGGVMTELSRYLLENKIVDGVIATSFEYCGNSIIPKTRIITEPDDLYGCQGSKYMPIPTLTVLKELKYFEGVVAYVGTPCQIAAIRKLQKEESLIKSKIKYCIGNFCGGYRDLREQSAFIKYSGIKNLEHFQYRGDGQPGYMRIEGDNMSWKYPYPAYAKLTGYMKVYRCRVCVDATAELADISCGDAWIDRFEGKSWSIGIIRNSELESIVNDMIYKGYLDKGELTFEELISSQRGNLTSKKERYLSRRKIFSVCDVPYTSYDGGYNTKPKYSTFFELKVLCSEYLKLLLYKLHLLSLFNKNK